MLSQDMAQQEWDRFLVSMDLDEKISEKLDDEDAKALENVRSGIMRALRNGSLVIGNDGEAVFTPRRGENRKPVTFSEPTAGVLTAADRRKEGHNAAKGIAMLAEWSGENPDRFAKMKASDFAVCMNLFALFFG